MLLKYLLKLWISTLLLAPIIFGIYEYFIGDSKNVLTAIELSPILFIFSILFSLPTLIVAFIVNKLTSKQNFSFHKEKVINIVIAFLGIICTLLVIKGSLIPTLIPIYMISLSIAVFILETIFKQKPSQI